MKFYLTAVLIWLLIATIDIYSVRHQIIGIWEAALWETGYIVLVAFIGVFFRKREKVM